MRKVGLKILKNKLSEYVRLAAAGETVLVTASYDGRPLAAAQALGISIAAL
jgi:antitoxin (DNA-binding transcriptional repressor) of toxin-antitoxin stability system